MTHSRLLPALALGAALLISTGCTTTNTSNTARTAVEQLLISNAVDQALDKVDFRPFAGQVVFVDEKYLDCVDKAYVAGSVRHRLLHSGATLAPKAEEANVVVELRSGTVGTNTSESFVGVPEVQLPGMISTPEFKLITRTHQLGIAKIGLVAYDAKTNETLGAGGTSLAESDDSNYYIVGVGPFQRGSLRNEVNASTGKIGGLPLAARPQQAPSRIPVNVAFAPPAPAASPVEAPVDASPADPSGSVQYTSEESGEVPVKTGSQWYDASGK